MSYTISIDVGTNGSYVTTYTGNGSTKEETYTVEPLTPIYGLWHECNNSSIFTNFPYNYNGLTYTASALSTYLNDAVSTCPNALSFQDSNNILMYAISLYGYTSSCNSSSNSFQGKYENTLVALTYDINTNVASNISCNTDVSTIEINKLPSYTTSYNFYNNSTLILTIQCYFSYESSAWTVTSLTITNYSATKAQTIVAISFLSNMFYNLSYYISSKKLNASSAVAYIALLNGLAPVIQIFNDAL